MVDKPTKLKRDPRLVPSIKSVGTLRYMSMSALHDDMFKRSLDCLVKYYNERVTIVTDDPATSMLQRVFVSGW
jgi:hypothetical protein